MKIFKAKKNKWKKENSKILKSIDDIKKINQDREN
jgi:hypothetical protein